MHVANLKEKLQNFSLPFLMPSDLIHINEARKILLLDHTYEGANLNRKRELYN